MCPSCEFNREPYEPSAWLQQLYRIYLLQRGGYPFKAADLSFEQWQDLGRLHEFMTHNKLMLT